jgi:Ca2+-binding RTX toxin-like protein
LLIGCAVLLLGVGCSGASSETSGKEQGSSPEATASEEGRCGGTRTILVKSWTKKGQALVPYITNDVPGCPKGGLLTGTNKPDHLAGKDGPDEIRGLGGSDHLEGVLGGDFIYGGPGDDELNNLAFKNVHGHYFHGHGHYFRFESGIKDLSKNVLHGGPGDDGISGGSAHDRLVGGKGSDAIYGGSGEDVLYGGDGNDELDGRDVGPKDTQRDKLYCGAGRDSYWPDKMDYVDSSCEKNSGARPHQKGYTGHDYFTTSASASPTPVPLGGTGGPALLLPAAALLLLGSGILTYAILRRG